ncbi:MAG: hypothetical protein WBC91_22000 [Phototrophicaceae bacterium]
MTQDCWQLNDSGFLIYPKPLNTLHGHLPDAEASQLTTLMTNLPETLASSEIMAQLEQLPLLDVSQIGNCLALELAFQTYGYLITAYILAADEIAKKIIPKNIAVPMVALAEKVQRPPILSYASFTLVNWKKIDPAGEIVVDNLELLHKFTHLRDAAWFTLIHVDIEARAAAAMHAIPNIKSAFEQDDIDTVMTELDIIHSGLDAMMKTLKRMPEHCHPTIYYQQVRPYMFGFTDVIFEGVEKYGGKPQSFLGETGAQSSIIPSLVRFLGVSHEESSMTQYLRLMQDYMPQPHRQFITAIDPLQVRQFVSKMNNAPLREAYNHTLQQLLTFRKMHIRYAASYIANQSSDSLGTGGTQFMTWLQQLIDETEAQLL